jgi:3',5'-cyclic AMP phosphodiesterase CpdA
MSKSCCKPSRREIMRLSALIAGGTLVSVVGADRAYAASTRSAGISPVFLDLVTVAEDSAIMTWYTGVPGTNDGIGQLKPAPAEGEVLFGTSPSRLNRRASGLAGTAYHYAELTGLEPGQTYYSTALSGGKAATATRLSGGRAAGAPAGEGVFSFTTPQPPPGRALFTIALVNDLHIGETVAGLVGGSPALKGISQVPGEPPYAKLMAQAMVTDARARGADFLLAAGDLSAEAEPVQLSLGKSILDGFGRYRRDYWVTRGNHDRAHAGSLYATCSAGQYQGHDCFRDDWFGPDELTYFTAAIAGLRLIGLDTYDKPGNGADDGGMSDEQFDWFTSQVLAGPDQPTLVFGHHPLQVDNLFTGASGSELDPSQAARTVALYKNAPGVFLHHAGHTHRNYRTVLFNGAHGSPVVQQEVGAVKEYPGGFTLLRVHEGGYALNFYKQREELAREWSERSRQEIDGLFPQITFGAALSDRNSVVPWDFSGLSQASRAGPRSAAGEALPLSPVTSPG